MPAASKEDILKCGDPVFEHEYLRRPKVAVTVRALHVRASASVALPLLSNAELEGMVWQRLIL